MKIAFFNWRDIRNPLAGGAEVYCHEVLSRLSEKHEVALFTSSFPGSALEEEIDGIRHVRYAGRYSIYAKARSCYRRHIQGRYDIVAESISGVPFFTPLFSKEPVVPFIHQLTRENWFSGLWFPAALFGYLTEDLMLSPYRSLPAIAPSDSTRSDLERLGFRDVHVIHGASALVRPDVAKEKAPTVLYLGRLTKSKRVGHVLAAFAGLRERVPGARLWIAGSGPEEGRLKSRAKELGLSDSVSFLGRVGEERKAELFARADVFVLPAVREGWGLVVLEANSCGTPVLGYDVPGLRDSVKGGVNGWLAPDGDLDALSARLVSMLSDREALARLSASSLDYSRKFSWDKTASEFERLFEMVLEGSA